MREIAPFLFMVRGLAFAATREKLLHPGNASSNLASCMARMNDVPSPDEGSSPFVTLKALASVELRVTVHRTNIRDLATRTVAMFNPLVTGSTTI